MQACLSIFYIFKFTVTIVKLKNVTNTVYSCYEGRTVVRPGKPRKIQTRAKGLRQDHNYGTYVGPFKRRNLLLDKQNKLAL